MSSKGQTTTDHDEIRRWVEARGGRPMAAQGTVSEGSEKLHLAFPDTLDAEALEPISWNEWFERFDQHDLALLIEETTSDGRQSLFNKLVRR